MTDLTMGQRIAESRKEGSQVTIQQCSWDGSTWISKILLPVDDGYEYWLVLEYPDGTKEQSVLQDYAAENLAETYTIGCKITYGHVDFDLKRQELVLSGYEFRITNPTLGQWNNIPWERAALVLTHIRGHARQAADTYELFKPMNDEESIENGSASAWSTITCYPNGPFRLPELEAGDGLELWIYLEKAAQQRRFLLLIEKNCGIIRKISPGGILHETNPAHASPFLPAVHRLRRPDCSRS